MPREERTPRRFGAASRSGSRVSIINAPGGFCGLVLRRGVGPGPGIETPARKLKKYSRFCASDPKNSDGGRKASLQGNTHEVENTRWRFRIHSESTWQHLDEGVWIWFPLKNNTVSMKLWQFEGKNAKKTTAECRGTQVRFWPCLFQHEKSPFHTRISCCFCLTVQLRH